MQRRWKRIGGRAREIAQVIKHMPRMWEALSSSPRRAISLKYCLYFWDSVRDKAQALHAQSPALKLKVFEIRKLRAENNEMEIYKSI